MNDQEFKKQLKSLIGNPPAAPANEYREILRKIDVPKNVSWLFLKPVMPAFALLLFVVLCVSPKNRGEVDKAVTPQSALSFYSEDTGLSTDVFAK